MAPTIGTEVWYAAGRGDHTHVAKLRVKTGTVKSFSLDRTHVRLSHPSNPSGASVPIEYLFATEAEAWAFILDLARKLMERSATQAREHQELYERLEDQACRPLLCHDWTVLM